MGFRPYLASLDEDGCLAVVHSSGGQQRYMFGASAWLMRVVACYKGCGVRVRGFHGVEGCSGSMGMNQDDDERVDGQDGQFGSSTDGAQWHVEDRPECCTSGDALAYASGGFSPLCSMRSCISRRPPRVTTLAET